MMVPNAGFAIRNYHSLGDLPMAMNLDESQSSHGIPNHLESWTQNQGVQWTNDFGVLIPWRMVDELEGLTSWWASTACGSWLVDPDHPCHPESEQMTSYRAIPQFICPSNWWYPAHNLLVDIPIPRFTFDQLSICWCPCSDIAMNQPPICGWPPLTDPSSYSEIGKEPSSIIIHQ